MNSFSKAESPGLLSVLAHLVLSAGEHIFLLAGSALSSSVTRHSPSSPPAPLITPESCLDSHTTSKHWWGMFCKFQSSVLFLCHSTFTPPIIHSHYWLSFPHLYLGPLSHPSEFQLYQYRKFHVSQVKCKVKGYKVKNTFSWTILSEFKFWLCFLVAVQPWPSCLSSLSLNVFTCKMEIMRVSISLLYCEG